LNSAGDPGILARTHNSKSPTKAPKTRELPLERQSRKLLLSRFMGLRKKEAEFTDGSLKSIILALVTSF
jgi:hypothetical protein